MLPHVAALLTLQDSTEVIVVRNMTDILSHLNQFATLNALDCPSRWIQKMLNPDAPGDYFYGGSMVELERECNYSLGGKHFFCIFFFQAFLTER